MITERRFAILEHDHPFLHWDLMLEADGMLATWRLLQAPGSNLWSSSEKLPDHRLHYLDYEGPVSGNRGYVKRVLCGSYIGSLQVSGAEAQFLLCDCEYQVLHVRRFDTDCPEWQIQ